MPRYFFVAERGIIMKNKKIISAAAAVCMIISSSHMVFANDKEEVYVTIENNTLSVSDGAPWEGEKISRYVVPISSGMTVSEATAIALSENELSGAGLEGSWVTELAGLNGSATEMGSWMYSVNDYFGGNTCNMQTVEDGDEIVWEYSSSWGSDLGTDYMNADTSLISIDIDGGTLSTRFDGEKTEYYLTLDENADRISVDPTMKNRYFQARVYKNLSGTDYDSAEFYHHGEEIPVAVGDKITIACGVKGWENGFYYGDQVQTVDEHIYVLEVCDSAPYEITAPENSTVQVFSQIKNYNNAEIMMSDSENNGDGTKTVRFDLPDKMKNYTYRVSAENKITKAGYIKTGDSELNITFSENDDPNSRPQYDTSSGMGKYAEDSMLLNINSQNYLRLKSGDEYTVRAFRTWQIVNSTTANIIIEPDFHYNIVDGDSVEITGDGNTAVVKAVKSGVSVIEVTYDAIEIGGNTSLGGLYGASDPDRTGLFIVNVDGDESDKITMPDWDTEFDTVYFTGESGTYEFKPQADGEITVECNGETIERNDNGAYELTINAGNNIVSAKCGDTVEYTVIKGGKVEFKDTENGFKINGLHMPLPKMAGVYNPGFGSSVKTQYGDVTSKGAQYDYINNNEVSVTETGTLTDGVIYVKNMGYEKGAHRSITEDGMGPNFNASSYEYSFSSLPDIWVSSGNDIFTACYDENGVMTNINKYDHIIENDESDRTFVWNSMKPVER